MDTTNMIFLTSSNGGHRTSSSTSGASILAAFIPTFLTFIVYIAIFIGVRNYHRKFYAPRTFLGTVPEKDRTPSSGIDGTHWIHDFWDLTNSFVLQHNSLDAYLYLRFVGMIVVVALFGMCITWPILIPVNVTGGGDGTQLDRFSFTNIARNESLWAHTIVAWVFFGSVLCFIAWERLRLIGVRQAYLLDEKNASKLSARTVLFLNVPREDCAPEKLQDVFGGDAVRGWPLSDCGDLEDLVQKRNDEAFALEGAQMDLVVKAIKLKRKNKGRNVRDAEEGQPLVPDHERPTQRSPPVVGSKRDPIEHSRAVVSDLVSKIEARRNSPGRNLPVHTAIFVEFPTRKAAHIAFEKVDFHPKAQPLSTSFLAPTPKEVIWKNISMDAKSRMSKSSLALVFVVAFTIFFSIPIGIIGTFSNIQYVGDNFSWLAWVTELPDWALGVIQGLLPPFLTSWFVSFVPKLFRHIAKLSGEPTNSQAELKVQSWFFVFQVFQVFLVTTFSSGAAAVVYKIIQSPEKAPDLLAASLPQASNFYLAYFVLQGFGAAASSVLNYSDLFSLMFYERFWDKTPRQHFTTYSQMKGMPWGSWYPKFTNFIVIILAYACIAPLTLGFAFVGIYVYYLSYRYSLLYVRQTKVDTRGEAYKRALQQMPTGIYLALLCLIGLFSAREATTQTILMIVLLVFTAVVNFVLDRILRPLELYLGADSWQEQEVPLLAEEDGIDPNDEAALHVASHGRRLGIDKLPKPAWNFLSTFFDKIITSGREETKAMMYDKTVSRGGDDNITPLTDEDIEKAYLPPSMTSKTPKLWIPRDSLGVSKREVEQNVAAGIPSTDEAAEIDGDGKLHWDHEFSRVPIYNKPKDF